MSQNRILYDNAVLDAESLLVPSSEVATLPATFLQDQLRQKPWRTNTGWTIVAGFNDQLKFERPPGTPKTATIPAGNYVSGTALATAITAALEAADAAPLWECTYTGANKFRIRDAAGAPVLFNLMFSTDFNNKGIQLCIGFIHTDHTGASDYTAEQASYQSRHFLKIHRSDAATINALAVILLDHTGFISGFIPGGFKVEANATDSWDAPTFSVLYEDIDNTDVSVLFFATQTFAWWRITFFETSNILGYFELGKLFLGPYVDPSINVSDDLANEPVDFSSVEAAVDGSHFVDQRRAGDRWSLTFDTMEAADKAILDTLLDAVSVGENFYFCWNKNDANGKCDGTNGTSYGYLPVRPREKYFADPYWTYSFPFYEAL